MVSAKRSVIIRGSGVDCHRFVPRPIPAGIPLVVLPSRMQWDKGIDDFVQAAEILRRKGVAVRMALVGGADGRTRTAIAEEGLQAWVASGAVEWWGQRADMPEVLASSALVCLPTHGEGMPKALLEAGASGRPIDAAAFAI